MNVKTAWSANADLDHLAIGLKRTCQGRNLVAAIADMFNKGIRSRVVINYPLSTTCLITGLNKPAYVGASKQYLRVIYTNNKKKSK